MFRYSKQKNRLDGRRSFTQILDALAKEWLYKNILDNLT